MIVARGTVISILLSTFIILFSGCSQPLQTPTIAVEVEIKFIANWWTVEQMEDLDPDDPPIKKDRIDLQKWDPSDPVGTPHPDIIDVTVSIQNLVSEYSTKVHANYRWLVGPISKKSDAQWTDVEPMTINHLIQQTAQPDMELSMGTLKIKDKLYTLFQSDQWAYTLEVTVFGSSVKGEPGVFKKSRRLDLKLAD